MKTKTFLFLLFAILFLWSTLLNAATFTNPPPGTLFTNVTVTINAPTNIFSTNAMFRIVGSTNIALSVSNYPVLANVWMQKTNVIGTNFIMDVRIAMPAPAQLFVAVAPSNSWGIGPFSGVAQTEVPPLGDSVLSVQPGP